MNLQFFHLPTKNRKDEPNKHALVLFQEPQHNTNEGSEFLDDALRMEDLPRVRTEESISAGSPEYLL